MYAENHRSRSRTATFLGNRHIHKRTSLSCAGVSGGSNGCYLAVSRFLLARARRRRNAARKLSRSVSGSTPATSKLLPPHSAQRQSDDEIRQKIDLRARKPVVEPAPYGFQYDPDEPLRLINPV